MPSLSLSGVVAIALIAPFALPAAAQPVPLSPAPAGVATSHSLGIEFAHVGSPGNSGVPQSMFFFNPQSWHPTLGVVNYDFRISRTELTYTEFSQFLTAYLPHYHGEYSMFEFLDTGLTYNGGPQNDPASYQIRPGYELAPINISWRVAARYVNWLNNDKRTDAAAFENGAYDTSTFTRNTNGTYNDQLTHNPDARYWIPTEDEWFKAMYFDPNRFGPGLQGYWLHPNSSNTPPIVGLPSAGGETNAGSEIGQAGIFAMPIASYPGVMSPWGMLDGSGGADEFLENGNGQLRTIRGSHIGGSTIGDRIDGLTAGGNGYRSGLRIAALVPSPATSSLILFTALLPRWRSPRSSVSSL